ncbi:MAG: mechanosensitive ion channel family protein [Thermoprotei archaeon]|nr:MAG: mechanosensitive ion channel family protein [Thermoprotei archaeon]
MLESIVSYMSGIDWILIAKAVAVAVAGLTISWLLRLILFKVLVRALPVKLVRMITRIIYYVLVFLVLVSVLGTIGIDLTGLVVAGGVVGIILGFALQNTVANLFSGLFLQWEKPFKIGNGVKIGGIEGIVIDQSILSTRIRGYDGVIHRVPNYTIFQSEITNYHGSVARRVDFRIGIAYREDAEKAYNVIKAVLDQHPYVLADPPPDVFVVELASSSVDIMVRAWIPNVDGLPWKARMELLWLIKKAIDEAGIEIPFIQTDIWFRTPLKIEATSLCNKDENVDGSSSK